MNPGGSSNGMTGPDLAQALACSICSDVLPCRSESDVETAKGLGMGTTKMEPTRTQIIAPSTVIA